MQQALLSFSAKEVHFCLHSSGGLLPWLGVLLPRPGHDCSAYRHCGRFGESGRLRPGCANVLVEARYPVGSISNLSTGGPSQGRVSQEIS